MKVITDERCTAYASPGHPERPERVSRTSARLRGQTKLPVDWQKPAPAGEVDILRAHSPRHIARLGEECDFDGDTPWHPEIAGHARRSVGAALSALRLALAGEGAFSLIRPPGHHATREQSMGFCYLNNIAVAALAAQAAGVKKVAVFDFDVHHGNGTEAILVNRPGISFFSIHQYPCYPGTGAENEGNNCFNYPVEPEMPRQDYRRIISNALADLEKVKPGLIAVSAGFDAYVRDPLAQGTLEAGDFYWLGGALRELGRPTFSLLEGGYSDDLPDLILEYLKGLEGL